MSLIGDGGELLRLRARRDELKLEIGAATKHTTRMMALLVDIELERLATDQRIAMDVRAVRTFLASCSRATAQ